MKLSARDPGWQIVLVGLAGATVHGAPEAVAGRLAAATDLPLRPIPAPEDAQRSLGDLARNGRGWLAAVPIDAGLPLPAGGSWAEALGAWRQPTVLVLSGEQLATGLPAAGTALLRQAGVPLLGLIQAEGPWQEHVRRRDGLPWLGLLPAMGAPQGDDGVEALLQVLLLRWRLLIEPPAVAW
jgi:hypothetical protein